jgi:hypothetical protein
VEEERVVRELCEMEGRKQRVERVMRELCEVGGRDREWGRRDCGGNE